MIGKLEVVEAILEIDFDLGRAPELTGTEAHRIFSLTYVCTYMCVCMYVCMFACMHEHTYEFRIGAQTK